MKVRYKVFTKEGTCFFLLQPSYRVEKYWKDNIHNSLHLV